MSTLAPQPALSKAVKSELAEQLFRLSVPLIKSRLIDEFLPKEKARLDNVTKVTSQEDQVSITTILRTAAKQRQWSPERACLEFSLAVDLIGIGKYRTLRRAIGEPVETVPRDIPTWDASSGTLKFRGKELRSLNAAAKNCRLILSAFEEDDWQTRIDNPLPPSDKKRQLSEALRNLNGPLQQIHFESCDKGDGIIWHERDSHPRRTRA